MAFTPVNELERLLVAAATDPVARPAFYRALAENELFFISEGEKPQREESLVIPAGKIYKIRALDLDGKPYSALFTSVQRISAVVPTEVGFVAMKGIELLRILAGHDLILNPGSDYGKYLLAAEVQSVVDGSIFRNENRPDVGGKTIQLGQPQHYPTHLTDALSRLFAQSNTVKAAYLAHAYIADVDKAAHTLIAIDSNEVWEKVLADVGIVAKAVLKPDEMVDFVPLTKNPHDVISKYMLNETKPFYVRKKWLGLF